MYWSSSCGRIELNITKAQAAQGSHPGSCDADITALRQVPSIRRQLNKLSAAIVGETLAYYGAWSIWELGDENHEENLDRLLWIACGDISEEAAA